LRSHPSSNDFFNHFKPRGLLIGTILISWYGRLHEKRQNTAKELFLISQQAGLFKLLH